MAITTPHLVSILGNLGTREWTTLSLEDVVMDLDIGTHDYEKGVEQPIRFDIEVLIEGTNSPKDDQIEEVIDYEYLYRSIEHSISERHSLLETVAAIILDNILEPENVVAGVVCLTKISPMGFEGKFGCTLARVKPNFEN